MEDARRIVFLAALTFDPDFDGTEVEPEWKSTKESFPIDVKVEVQYGILQTIGGTSEIADIIGRAFRHLDARRLGESRGRIPTQQSASSARGKAVDGGDGGYQFRKDGKTWAMAFEGESGRFPHCVGFQRIHHLLEKQGREVPIAELISISKLFGGDAALDSSAKKDIQGRMSDLEEVIESSIDPQVVALAKAELESLAAASASGLRGRSREVGNQAKAAADAVGRSIGRAIKQLEGEGMPKLATHLRLFIQHPTGMSPVYRPPRPFPWLL
jgi:hypothetical protein